MKKLVRMTFPDSPLWPSDVRGQTLDVEISGVKFPNGFEWGCIGEVYEAEVVHPPVVDRSLEVEVLENELARVRAVNVGTTASWKTASERADLAESKVFDLEKRVNASTGKTSPVVTSLKDFLGFEPKEIVIKG